MADQSGELEFGAVSGLALIDALPDSALILDARDRICAANTQAESSFGYARAELIGARLSLLVTEPARAPADSLLEPMTQTFERSGRRKDGREFPIELVLSSTGPAPAAFTLAVLRDRTRWQAEHEALREAVRAQSQLDSAAVGIVRLDGTGRITHVNDTWRDFARDNDADAPTGLGVGQNYFEVCRRSGDASALALVEGLQRVMDGQQAGFESVYTCHSPTRLRWFRMNARRPSGGGRALVLTHIDITSQHLAEARSRIQGCVADAVTTRKPLLTSCRELAYVVCEELEWDFLSVWRLDAASWTLSCVEHWARRGLPAELFSAQIAAARFAPGVALPGRAWAMRRAVWATDLELIASEELRCAIPSAARAAGLSSGFAFPVKYEDDVLAVIEIFGRIRQQPDLALMYLLEVAGAQLATSELRDRAERRAEAAQVEIDAAREQLEAVLACVPALVIAIDRDGALRFVNRTRNANSQAPGIPGSVAPEANASWRDYVPEVARERAESALAIVLAGGAPQTFDVTVVASDSNARYYINYMGPIRSGSQVTGVLLVSQDVTQMKLAQQELFGAQRLAAIGTLAAGVAHEINTPIQFVGDNVEFLREASHDVFDVLVQLQRLRDSLHAGKDAQLKAAAAATLEAEERAELDYLKDQIVKAFDSCAEGLGRVTSIVRSMKEFSHPAQKDMAPVDLNRAISATLTVARNEYKYVADVDLSLGELPLVTCYINEINQVVLNILINASHAIADANGDSQRRGTISVRTYVEGRNVVIAISDTGKGIPEEVRPRIFEPFFTTKEVGRGTGQGLAMAWTVVKEKHAGELSFETKLGVGTCFFIRLPISGKGPA